MHSDTIRSERRVALKRLSTKATELQTIRRQMRQDLDSRVKEVEALSRRVEVLSKVGELFRALMDKMVVDHVKSIEAVVTEGLRAIFVDQDLRFVAEVSTRYNKLAIDFFIRQGSIQAPPLEAFGGGPSSIASLILKVLTMRRLHKWPLLALDETLGGVSSEYVDRTCMFLNELASKTGFSFLLVTHKLAFLDHASIAYWASEQMEGDGTRRLQLKREDKRANQ